MKSLKNTILQETKDNSLTAINGVRFTSRETDVIACLLAGRSTKTIAQILSIEEKTVETHKYNIMRKLECNSKEGIINFVEKSPKFATIKDHYLYLLDEALFEKHLLKISQLSNKQLRCAIIYTKEEIKESLIDFLEKYLKIAGVQVRFKSREEHKSFNVLLHSLKSQKLDPIIHLQSEQASHNLLTPKTLLEEHKNLIFITLQENPYLTVFEILQKILPGISIDKIISEFKEQYVFATRGLHQKHSSFKSEINSSSFPKEDLGKKIWKILTNKEKYPFVANILTITASTLTIIVLSFSSYNMYDTKPKQKNIHGVLRHIGRKVSFVKKNPFCVDFLSLDFLKFFLRKEGGVV